MNDRLVEIFNDLASFEEYNKEPWKAKAYRNAAKNFSMLDYEIDSADQIKDIPGVGKAIYEKVRDYLADIANGGKGTFKRYEEFLASDAAKIKEMAAIKGLGMNKAKKLYQDGIHSLDELKKRVETLSIGDVIAPSTDDKPPVKLTIALSTGLKYEAHTDHTRMPVDVHDSIANPMIDALKDIPGVGTISAAGSARRFDGSEGYTIGDVDIIIGSDGSNDEQIRTKSKELLDEVVMAGTTKISGIKNSRQVDIRIVPIEDYGALLLHATGPAQFNVKCRTKAIQMGMTLNEYGLFKKDEYGAKVCVSKDEKEILDILWGRWIEPKDRASFNG